MKKLLFILSFMLFLPTLVYARSDKITVTLSDCVDGDTAKFIYNDEVLKARFLAVDTPELKKKDPYAKEALDYTCNKLKEADKIMLEFDENSDETDKYGRYLAWIWVDEQLLQKELISEGYAKVAYLYGDYKYTEELQTLEKEAKKQKLNIWNNYKEEAKEKNYITYIIIAILIIVIIFSSLRKSEKKKLLKKIIKKMN